MSMIERVTRVEGELQRMRKDVDRNVIVTGEQGAQLAALATDRARVITGAWVANGLTCIFVAMIMWLSQRAFASEAELFKRKLIEEVSAANHSATPVKHQ